VIEVKKKILVIALAVAMLVLPISVVFATKPMTMTLTGTYIITGAGDSYDFQASESDNFLYKTRNAPTVWTGDIIGVTNNHGNWLSKGGPVLMGGELAVMIMTFKFEDVTINDVGETGFVGSGALSIGLAHTPSRTEVFIKSGTGDLSSIRGKGTLTALNPFVYTYEIVVKINP